MYSVTLNGQVLDFHYKKLKGSKCHAFYIGDILIGKIFKMRRYWSAVSDQPNYLCPVDGFKTRYHASEFLLKLQGYWGKE